MDMQILHEEFLLLDLVKKLVSTVLPGRRMKPPWHFFFWRFDNFPFPSRIERVARDIFLGIGREPLVCLCVLKGGFKFCSDLLDHLNQLNRNLALTTIPVAVDFIRLRSYTVSIGS